MIFTFDVEQAAQKQGGAPAKVAKPANPDSQISNFSGFSSGEGPILDESAIPDNAMERRRQAVLRQLRENPNIVRAILVDDRADPEAVIVAVGLRDLYTFEVRISRPRFDVERFMGLVDKHSVRPADEAPTARPSDPTGQEKR